MFGKIGLVAGAFIIAAAALTLWQATRQEAKAESQFPPSGKFVTVDTHRVHYVQAGTGPDVILIHGASGNLRDWTFDAVGRLSDRYRVTAFDRPGLGYTDRINETGASITQQADLLSQAAAQLGISDPIVVGQSYGGAVTLAWAVDFPDRLSALVLLAAASNPWTSDLPGFYKLTSSNVLGPLVIPLLTAWVPNSKVRTALDEIFAPQHPPAGYLDHIGAGLTLRRASLRENALQRANLLEEITGIHPRYGAISMPVEILHGDIDTTVGLHIHSVPLSGQIPNAVLTPLEGIGHMPQHAATAQMDAAIDRAAARANLQ